MPLQDNFECALSAPIQIAQVVTIRLKVGIPAKENEGQEFAIETANLSFAV